MKTFPWARAMEIGLGHMRLAPRDFWRMTLPELAAAARSLAPEPVGAIRRVDMCALIDAFPDASMHCAET